MAAFPLRQLDTNAQSIQDSIIGTFFFLEGGGGMGRNGKGIVPWVGGLVNLLASKRIYSLVLSGKIELSSNW